MKKLVLMVAVVFLFAYSGSAIAATLGVTMYGKKCIGCHGKAGAGTPMASKLAGSDFIAGDGAPLKDVLSSGKTAKGKNHPKSTLSDAELDAIIAYLQSL